MSGVDMNMGSGLLNCCPVQYCVGTRKITGQENILETGIFFCLLR